MGIRVVIQILPMYEKHFAYLIVDILVLSEVVDKMAGCSINCDGV